MALSELAMTVRVLCINMEKRRACIEQGFLFLLKAL